MQLPELSITPEKLFYLNNGTTRSWLLMTAVEFKVFTFTVEKKTAAEIASHLKSHETNTALFLNALCALDLLEKRNGTYKNTAFSDTFLVVGKECYLGEFIFHMEQWNFQTREEMKEAILNGPPSGAPTSYDMGSMYAPHIHTMKNYARSGVAQLMSQEVSRIPEFPEMRSMLELGGAHGMDCIATVLKHPSLHGVVFDHPAVVEVTKEIIAEYALEERVTVMGGDYAADPIGGGYDLIYAKATLNFYKDDFSTLFKKIYKALNSGGVFVSVHDGLTDERTRPAAMVISWLSSGLKASDLSLDRDMIPDAMLQAGFKSVTIKPIPFYMGNAMDLCIRRK